jgi:hypothetical protein
MKNDVSNDGINVKKFIQPSPITILPMFFCWGIPPYDLSFFLLGSRGFLWVLIMGSRDVMGSPGYDSNISASSQWKMYVKLPSSLLT